MSNKVYDVLKWIAMIALPAITALYTTLATVWGWNYVNEISATLAAVNTCLGAILGISNYNYKNKER